MTQLRHGKICHIELPASDTQASAGFYERVFGWRVRRDGSALVFDDPTEELSGHWVARRPSSKPGLLFYIWVDDVAAAIKAVVAEGCELVQAIGGDPGEVTARFRDRGGNVIGLYREPRGRASSLSPGLRARAKPWRSTRPRSARASRTA